MPVPQNTKDCVFTTVIVVYIVLAIVSCILVLLFGLLYGTITNHYCYHNSNGIDFCKGYINENVMILSYQGQYDISYYSNNCNCDICIDSFNCDCGAIMCSLIGKYTNGVADTNCSVYDVDFGHSRNDDGIVENYYWSKSSIDDYSIGSYYNFYTTSDSNYKCYTEELINENGLQKYQFFVTLLTFASVFFLLVICCSLLYCGVIKYLKYKRRIQRDQILHNATNATNATNTANTTNTTNATNTTNTTNATNIKPLDITISTCAHVATKTNYTYVSCV
jgi:hypothetical protein